MVVGPGGVFILETKARTKLHEREGQAKHEIIYDGQSLQFPNWKDVTTINQVSRNTAWIKELLGEHLPKDLGFQPVVVIPGWYVTTKGNYPVKVMNEKYLVNYLAQSPRRFPDAALHAVLQRLDERCRTVDY